MKALVTGGGGFVGLYIVEQLLDRGDEVHVFCRGNYPMLKQLGVNVIRGDIRDSSAIINGCKNIEAVFHTAAVPGVWGSWSYYHGINTQGTINVIDACRNNAVQKLIFTSSPSVVFDGRDHLNADETLAYPETYLCHYPHTKALAEQAVLAANDPDRLLTVSLRPHLIWGPRDNHLIPRLITRAKAGRLRIVGSGENYISMAYVENVAHAHLQACDALSKDSEVAGQAYFINETEPVNLWEWLNTLLERAQLPPISKRISTANARRIGSALETVYGLLRLTREPPMTRFVAEQLSTSHTYSTAKAEQDFGYKSIVSVADGLAKLEPELRALARE